MKFSWKKKYPALETHEWEEFFDRKEANFCDYMYKCKTCKYKVYFDRFGFGRDHRKRAAGQPYNLMSCNDVLIKDIIE